MPDRRHAGDDDADADYREAERRFFDQFRREIRCALAGGEPRDRVRARYALTAEALEPGWNPPDVQSYVDEYVRRRDAFIEQCMEVAITEEN